MPSPDLRPTSAFQVTWTAQPPCPSATPAQGRTAPYLARRGPPRSSLQHWPLSRQRRRASSAPPPPLTTMTQQRIKNYLGHPSASFARSYAGKRALPATRRLPGAGVRQGTRCPNGRGYASSWRGAGPAFPGASVPAPAPPQPDAPRGTAPRSAVNTHRGCRVGRTRPGAGSAPRRSSLPGTGGALREPRRRWRPLSPPLRTNGRTVCLPMRSPGVPHRPGAPAASAHAPCRWLASRRQGEGGGARGRPGPPRGG
ncbi:translation initiation factor IF-2-like [Canis lupus dingo]|uniref:translation initiation factor IF-2-like n=1 Tax=Canis lupus dingo TaxID=286419 RepID=UPI0020C1C728|nr:translation initiation factor IF-2-like [Canis lupus dingo]